MRCQRAAHQTNNPSRTGACQLCSSAMLGEELCFRHTTILGSRRWSQHSNPSCVDRSTGGLWLGWCVCSKRFCTHIPWNQIQRARRLAWPCWSESTFIASALNIRQLRDWSSPYSCLAFRGKCRTRDDSKGRLVVFLVRISKIYTSGIRIRTNQECFRDQLNRPCFHTSKTVLSHIF